jgi:hypothetical protein
MGQRHRIWRFAYRRRSGKGDDYLQSSRLQGRLRLLVEAENLPNDGMAAAGFVVALRLAAGISISVRRCYMPSAEGHFADMRHQHVLHCFGEARAGP